MVTFLKPRLHEAEDDEPLRLEQRLHLLAERSVEDLEGRFPVREDEGKIGDADLGHLRIIEGRGDVDAEIDGALGLVHRLGGLAEFAVGKDRDGVAPVCRLHDLRREDVADRPRRGVVVAEARTQPQLVGRGEARQRRQGCGNGECAGDLSKARHGNSVGFGARDGRLVAEASGMARFGPPARDAGRFVRASRYRRRQAFAITATRTVPPCPVQPSPKGRRIVFRRRRGLPRWFPQAARG
ncbi:hypothetical protein OH818_14865 [Jiella pelagia]|uniref:Uncharacterized protein n=1 Tax=Jiella pelagia TaxID=2986949 RepID=A0ABY7BU61_9HYPH|nr:hypothetical protein OH818_14865 [Jiella pelagia]